MFKIAFSIAALLTAEPAPAAQDGAVRQLLAAADQLFVGRASNTGIEGFGDLKDGEDATFTLALRPGGQYFVVGVCDQDCSDLDLEARNSAGVELDSDYEVDDAPVLSFTAGRTGEVALDVLMSDCSAEPCRYGYRVYLAN